MARHPPTLILADLPKQALVGIDFLSLTASSRFNGFTSLPTGWHFLFIGATTELSSRQGIWFFVPDFVGDNDRLYTGQKRSRADSQPLGVRGAILPPAFSAPEAKDWLAVLKWDVETEKLRVVRETELHNWRERLLTSADFQSSLFPYRQSVQPEQRIVDVEAETAEATSLENFASLNDFTTPQMLNRICGISEEGFWSLDTASSTQHDAEAEHIPGLEGNERFKSEALGLVDIDLKRTWPEDATGRERTDAARDRSWRLEQVIDPNFSQTATRSLPENDETDGNVWGSELLGEMQLCFTAVLTIANWSCMAQWRRIIELVMTCSAIVPQQAAFFTAFLNLLAMQLIHTNLVEGGLFDVRDEGGDFLKDLLRRFSNTLAELEDEGSDGVLAEVRKAMARLQDTVKDIWGWELGNEWVRRGMVQLEDGEMVELETQDMEDEDERGEYAPVVVELASS